MIQDPFSFYLPDLAELLPPLIIYTNIRFHCLKIYSYYLPWCYWKGHHRSLQQRQWNGRIRWTNNSVEIMLTMLISFHVSPLFAWIGFEIQLSRFFTLSFPGCLSLLFYKLYASKKLSTSFFPKSKAFQVGIGASAEVKKNALDDSKMLLSSFTILCIAP